MGVSIINYSVGESRDSAWGAIRSGSVFPLEGEYRSHREVMALYFSERDKFEKRINQNSLDSKSIRFNSPITADVQLFCQGLNYTDHRVESGVSTSTDEENLIFMKAASSICAPNESIIRPSGCQLLDYEIELALVLKTEILSETIITQSSISDYVGGLVLCNDVSARDFMFGSPMLQWFRGKSQRTFCPMGPVLYLMDKEDFKHLFNLQLTLKLNGAVKQSAKTDQLIHRPAETLTELSTFTNLAVGDCLLTGTPGGVLAQSSLKVGLSILLNFTKDEKRRKKFTEAQLAQTRFLESGDVLELSISTPNGDLDLGVQRNKIIDA